MARTRNPTLAERADKYVCYQESVQAPDVDIPVTSRIFRKHRGRPPRTLREDFCGTAAFSSEWVRGHRDNRAWAIDLDPEPLDWGRRHNVSQLSPEAQGRIKLIEGDVLTVGHEPVDVTVAFNFSYSIFDRREQMVSYFRQARAALGHEGLFFLDVYGGPEAQTPQLEERDCGDFTYVWEQASFDPIRGHGRNFIHFHFPDGSRLQKAFAYDWRIWSLPELREALADAGFSDSHVYWEGTERQSGEGNGVFSPRESAHHELAWIAYLVAIP